MKVTETTVYTITTHLRTQINFKFLHQGYRQFLKKKETITKNRQYGTSNIAIYLTDIPEPHYQFSVPGNVQFNFDCQLLWPTLCYRQIP
jgi:DNA-binding sugar fermentation-stimulating protein